MLKVVEFTPKTAAREVSGDGPRGFFAALTAVGLETAIPNLSARLGVIAGPNAALPLVVSVDGGGACYLASFTRMYMDGAADELGSSKSSLLKLFAPGVAIGGYAARALGMDDIVSVNNNLHPTCHAGNWSGIDIAELTGALIASYPSSAIWVRGLTDHLHGAELARLKASGYVIAPSRPIDVLDSTPKDWKITRHLQGDLNRLRRLPGLAPFAGGPFSESDFTAMERLSRSATVLRHSALMPHYSKDFFRVCAGWQACLFVGLRDDTGTVRGFATIVTDEPNFTCGTLGYDLGDEHARLIYPALIALTMDQAIKAGRAFNLGYGAAEFKRRRGTTPAMEMNAFYVRHLPAIRRSLWQTTLGAMGALAGPVMKRL